MRDRLDERLRLLTGGSRDALPRHRTLAVALERSHGLLVAPEQAVLRRLGVFVGGFTLELAQNVAGDEGAAVAGAGDEWGVLETLGALARSLVAVDAGEPVRYRLLDSVRAFALERLTGAGEAAACRTRHARGGCALRRGGRGPVGRRGHGHHHRGDAGAGAGDDNARAPLAWAVDTGDWSTAMTLAGLYNQLGLVRELLPVMQMARAAPFGGNDAA